MKILHILQKKVNNILRKLSSTEYSFKFIKNIEKSIFKQILHFWVPYYYSTNVALAMLKKWKRSIANSKVICVLLT